MAVSSSPESSFDIDTDFDTDLVLQVSHLYQNFWVSALSQGFSFY